MTIQVKRRKKLHPGKIGNDSESSDDDVFYRHVVQRGWWSFNSDNNSSFQRHCDDEEAEDSSSSENSAGEEVIVPTKKTKGLNKIMDLPSVRVLEPSKSLHYERSENNILWQAMASLGMKDMRPLDDKKTGNL